MRRRAVDVIVFSLLRVMVEHSRDWPGGGIDKPGGAGVAAAADLARPSRDDGASITRRGAGLTAQARAGGEVAAGYFMPCQPLAIPGVTAGAVVAGPSITPIIELAFTYGCGAVDTVPDTSGD